MTIPIDDVEVTSSELLADKFNFLTETVEEMQSIIDDIGLSFPSPEKQVLTNGNFCYRHRGEHKRNIMVPEKWTGNRG